MIEELNEGEVIVPRRVERDASKWVILSTDGEEVTFRAGTEIFVCHKNGIIYREWEKEAKRRAAGGVIEEQFHGTIIATTHAPLFELGKTGEFTPIVQLVDSQLEERQHRIGDLRKRAAALDWCDHDKDMCTGKCRVIDEIRDIEKRILGDP